MYNIEDFKNPWDAVKTFETTIANYTNAPYCITTDNCSHAIKISLLLTKHKSLVKFPARTYLSVLMVMEELGIPYELLDISWRESYQFENTNIWDAARCFKTNMYIPGTIQCLSFGNTKPLQIGRGGCILTDNKELYEAASKMRMDGRDIFAPYSHWSEQKEFKLGFHYYMRPEECVTGLNLLSINSLTEQLEKYYNYPDCRLINITP